MEQQTSESFGFVLILCNSGGNIGNLLTNLFAVSAQLFLAKNKMVKLHYLGPFCCSEEDIFPLRGKGVSIVYFNHCPIHFLLIFFIHVLIGYMSTFFVPFEAQLGIERLIFTNQVQKERN